ncbi:MAG: ABC transporter ATP-binding protein [Nitrososphaerota archaeon]|nr:ABC transporter ATP-binding protein [Nitrososphaerota archaeon]
MNNIEVVYDKYSLAVKGISLNVEKGGIVGLVGPNGAGKSTTLKSISGLIKIERGEVRRGTIEFEGRRIENSDPEKLSKMGIVHVLEGRKVFSELTVEENLMTGLYSGGRRLPPGQSDFDLVYSYFPRLKELRRLRAGYISGGEQQMLVIGRALLMRPKLLLLDEPSLGLAPRVVTSIFKTVTQLRDNEGISIILADQNARTVMSVSDYVYVIENGRVAMAGRPHELAQKEEMKEFYLGLSREGERSYAVVKHWKIRRRWV